MRESNGNVVDTTTTQEIVVDLPKEVGEPGQAIVAEENNNDNEITDMEEWLDVIANLCQVGKTGKELLDFWGISVYQGAGGNKIFIQGSEVVDIKTKFFNEFYNDKYAYIDTGDGDIRKGKIYIHRDVKRFVRTPDGVLSIPGMYVIGSGRTREYVLFPVTAVMSSFEGNLYNFLCGTTRTERMTFESIIMENLIKLTTLREDNVVNSNAVCKEIEDMCRACGTCFKVSLESSVLKMCFGWRLCSDTDGNYEQTLLPPFNISIDLVSCTVRGEGFHPHHLGSGTLCLGGVLKDIQDRAFRDRNLTSLVAGFIQFANQWTSSDADGTDRSPANCVREAIHGNYLNKPRCVSWYDMLEGIRSLGITTANSAYFREFVSDKLLSDEEFRTAYNSLFPTINSNENATTN